MILTVHKQGWSAIKKDCQLENFKFLKNEHGCIMLEFSGTSKELQTVAKRLKFGYAEL